MIYAPLVKRGLNVEVIEDVPKIYNVIVSLRIPYKVTKAILAPQMKEIDFRQDGSLVSYSVPELDCYQMVVIEYEQSKWEDGVI